MQFKQLKHVPLNDFKIPNKGILFKINQGLSCKHKSKSGEKEPSMANKGTF